jgi:hypothetical protein
VIVPKQKRKVKEVEKIKYVEVPKEVIKEKIKYVDVPREVIKEVKGKTKKVMVDVPRDVVREVVKYVDRPIDRYVDVPVYLKPEKEI